MDGVGVGDAVQGMAVGGGVSSGDVDGAAGDLLDEQLQIGKVAAQVEEELIIMTSQCT